MAEIVPYLFLAAIALLLTLPTRTHRDWAYSSYLFLGLCSLLFAFYMYEEWRRCTPTCKGLSGIGEGIGIILVLLFFPILFALVMAVLNTSVVLPDWRLTLLLIMTLAVVFYWISFSTNWATVPLASVFAALLIYGTVCCVFGAVWFLRDRREEPAPTQVGVEGADEPDGEDPLALM